VEVPALAGDPYRLWARLDAEHLRIPTVSDGAQEVAGAAAHVQHPCRRPQVAPQRSHIAPALPVAHAGRDPAPGEGRVILRVEARQLLSHRTGIEVAEAAAPAADQAETVGRGSRQDVFEIEQRLGVVSAAEVAGDLFQPDRDGD